MKVSTLLTIGLFVCAVSVSLGDQNCYGSDGGQNAPVLCDNADVIFAQGGCGGGTFQFADCGYSIRSIEISYSPSADVLLGLKASSFGGNSFGTGNPTFYSDAQVHSFTFYPGEHITGSIIVFFFFLRPTYFYVCAKRNTI
jgi:hypothetical protein